MEQIVPSTSVGKRTYSVDEIQDMLGICKRKAYDLCKSGNFSIVRIGRTIRVSKRLRKTYLIFPLHFAISEINFDCKGKSELFGRESKKPKTL